MAASGHRAGAGGYEYWTSCFIFSAAISAWLTASHPNSEVKQVRAGVVLRWGTTREGPVLRFLFHSSSSLLANGLRPLFLALQASKVSTTGGNRATY